MGNTMEVPTEVYEIIKVIKRSRPLDWIVDEPAPKRIRISPFDEDGAKAVKLPDTNHISVSVS
jgi:hypothetical protein